MSISEMKLAIYESYSNGEISKDTAIRLINSFEKASINNKLDTVFESVDNAESSFMETAIKYSTGEVSQEIFEAEAKSFADKIKDAWEAFKKWLKGLIGKITGNSPKDTNISIHEWKYKAMQQCASDLSRASSKKFRGDDSYDWMIVEYVCEAEDNFAMQKKKDSKKKINVSAKKIHDLDEKIHKYCDKITSNAESASGTMKNKIMKSIRGISNKSTSIDNMVYGLSFGAGSNTSMQNLNDELQRQSIQQANDMAMRQSINSANMSMSLAASGGMNPYMYGMM